MSLNMNFKTYFDLAKIWANRVPCVQKASMAEISPNIFNKKSKSQLYDLFT
jgi:hypothetical protein